MCLLAVRTSPAARCPCPLPLSVLLKQELHYLASGALDVDALRRRPSCVATCDKATIAVIVKGARSEGCGKYEKGTVATKLKLGARGCTLLFVGATSGPDLST
jgi:hypothetical protein